MITRPARFAYSRILSRVVTALILLLSSGACAPHRSTPPQKEASSVRLGVLLDTSPVIVLTAVLPGSPQERSGLKTGDIIRKIAGVESAGIKDFPGTVQSLDNIEHPAEVLREGKIIPLMIGFRSPADKRLFIAATTKGMLVRQVVDGSLAAEYYSWQAIKRMQAQDSSTRAAVAAAADRMEKIVTRIKEIQQTLGADVHCE